MNQNIMIPSRNSVVVNNTSGLQSHSFQPASFQIPQNYQFKPGATTPTARNLIGGIFLFLLKSQIIKFVYL